MRKAMAYNDHDGCDSSTTVVTIDAKQRNLEMRKPPTVVFGWRA